MLKKPSRRNNGPRAANSRRYRSLVLIILTLSILGTTMLAQVSLRKKATSISGEVSVMNLSAASPAKEYVYAGSKLVATEEPISFLDVNTSTPFYSDILKIARQGITLGCGGGNYCPSNFCNPRADGCLHNKSSGRFQPADPAIAAVWRCAAKQSVLRVH